MKHFNEILREHMSDAEWRDTMIYGLTCRLNHLLADKTISTEFMDIMIDLEENGISADTAQRVAADYCQNSSLYDDDMMDYCHWTAEYYRACAQLFELMAEED